MNRERLESEIKNTVETNAKLEKIKVDADLGIELNNMVLEKFREEFEKCPETKTTSKAEQKNTESAENLKTMVGQ